MIVFSTSDRIAKASFPLTVPLGCDGWTSSGTVTATVNVVDNGDGSLEATVEYTNNATIVNTYEASGTAEIQVTKTISGADWPSGKTLTFILAGNNAPMPETTTGTLTAPGTVTFGPITYSESDAGKTYTYTVSENGTYSVYVDDTDSFPIETIGPKFEKHDLFPEQVNTEFVQVIDRSHVKMRVWERGSGETLACGTGACATVVASIVNEKTEDEVTVSLLGGDLKIRWDRDQNTVYMTGPATTVFEGDI